MYTTYFGLTEKPFKLVPNPAYLFLSRSHEEALAHLAYALAEGDGFLLITGEVGTGKTTLCRAFLERLAPSVEAALIFNPRLDAVQLLKAINDEFEIDASADTVKGLVDVFNAFLLRMWAAGRKVVVLIDEAQNLNR
jgi:general secretion pathway protein A